MQAKWGTHGDHPVIAIAPSSVQECYNETVRAFNLAEEFRVPVIFLMDEIIGHLREGCELIPSEELEIINRGAHNISGMTYAVGEGNYVPEFAAFGEGEHYNITGLFHDDGGFPTNDNHLAYSQERRLLDKIRMNQDAIEKWDEADIEDAEVVVVCYGGTARAVSGALEKAKEIEGFPKVGMFRPITVWPFPKREMIKISEKCKHIIVAEHNDGQMLMEVQRVVKSNCPVSFVGKIDGTTITPDDILAAIREVYEDAK